MGYTERIELYKKIEAHRTRPLIVYVTSKREGAAVSMATDALPHIIEQIDCIPDGTESVDFLIASYGGDPMVAWRIISLIRQKVKKVSVLIPQSAYSAATLVALGADEIVMHPNGHLGPVDMQITTFSGGKPQRFSTEDISAFLDFVRDNLKITDQEHIRMLFEVTCKEVGSLGIGFTARSSKLAVDLNLPLPAALTASYQTTMAEVKAAVVSTIEPVDFECKNAVVESSKMAHAFNTKGKILSCRNPDLMIHYNVVITSRGWEKLTTKTA